MKQTLFTIATAGSLAMAMAFSACNDTSEPMAEDFNPVKAVIRADISGQNTRTNGNAWDNGDVIGISTLTSDGKTRYTNCPYTYGSTGFGPAGETTIYFQDEKETVFCAYYPFQGTGGTEAGIVTATTDAAAQEDQPAIDFLYATGATASKASPTVNFTGEASFSHTMSQITLTFREGFNAYIGGGNLKGYTLDGLKLSGTFNTSTGIAEADAGAETEKLSVEFPENAVSGGSCTSSLILFPQEVKRLTLTVRLNSTDYSTTLSIPDGALKAGNNYSYSISFSSPVEISVGEATITGWEQVEGGDVSAEM